MKLKKRKSKKTEAPREQRRNDRVYHGFLQSFIEWVVENQVDTPTVKLLLQEFTSGDLATTDIPPAQTVDPNGFTVIYEDTEIGVGLRVGYLRTQAKDEAAALAEFRRLLFRGTEALEWAWILCAVTVHEGVVMPEYVKVFPSLPKMLIISWPDTPY